MKNRLQPSLVCPKRAPALMPRVRHLLGAALLVATGGAHALLLPSTGYIQFGDVLTYSLPSLAIAYDTINGGGTGPGNPYYVDSTPGAIKDLIVVYTGASGQPVTTNQAGMDDAFAAPNGTIPYFATAAGNDPGGAGQFSGDLGFSWDSTLSALKTFQGGQPLVFFFNNNDTNEDQNLGIWARTWVTNAAGATVGQVFCLSNAGNSYGFPSLGDPRLNGNPGSYACSASEAAGNPGVNALTGKTDYVLSGGEVWLDSMGNPVAPGTSGAKPVNHNLGANQAAYAAVLPELDALLASLYADASLDLGTLTLHIDLKLGCDQAWDTTATTPKDLGDSPACVGKRIDNGYEQLFIGTLDTTPTPTPRDLPEPALLWLCGLGMLALARRLLR